MLGKENSINQNKSLSKKPHQWKGLSGEQRLEVGKQSRGTESTSKGSEIFLVCEQNVKELQGNMLRHNPQKKERKIISKMENII